MNPQIVNYIVSLIAMFASHLLLGFIPGTPPDVVAAAILLVGFFTHHFLDAKTQEANAAAQLKVQSDLVTMQVINTLRQSPVNASNAATLTT